MSAGKVVHVSTSDMSMGVLLRNHLLAFRNAGYEVVAVCTPGPYVEEVERLGIRVEPVSMIRSITPGADLRALTELYRLFRRERPDIVHTHTPKAALLGQYAALLARVPHRVHTIHGLYFPGHMTPRTRPLYVALERLTMRFAHLALSQNPEDVSVALEEGICRPDQIEYLGNGIDVARFDPARLDVEIVSRLRAEMQLPQGGGPVVGIVARVNREKGYEEFFAAAERLARRFPSARFLIVGPVEREKANHLEPEELTRAHGLNGRVAYAGLRSEMPELYSLMDVLVLPSHREGFPRSPMEAACMARPVVATDIRGCRQVVLDGETGFLVPVRDPERLSERIAYLLDHPEESSRMGEAARRHALEHFDEREVIRRTLRAYAALLGENGATR